MTLRSCARSTCALYTFDACRGPIEDIQVGDLVLSRAEDGVGEDEYRAVTAVYERVMPIVELTLRDEDGTEFTLRSSGEHPFWTERDGWASVSELEVGDVLRGPDDAPVELVGIVATDEVEVTYNLTVEGNHTFYVYDADGEGLWGHNVDDGCPVSFAGMEEFFELGEQRLQHLTGAHTLERHGGSVTDAQLIHRARTGVGPDGHVKVHAGTGLALRPPHASAYCSDAHAIWSEHV